MTLAEPVAIIGEPLLEKIDAPVSGRALLPDRAAQPGPPVLAGVPERVEGPDELGPVDELPDERTHVGRAEQRFDDAA